MRDTNEILLSICIPTYNRGEILRETLKKITSESFEKIEILVSDNASNDDTRNIVRKYDSFGIKYYRNSENMGVVFNIIKSLELSSGKYVVLSSDEDTPIVRNILSAINRYDQFSVDFISGFSELERNDFRVDNFNISVEGIIFPPGPETIAEKGFSNGYIFSGIFRKSKIDFNDLWIQYALLGYGFLNIYPHQYIVNQFLMNGNSVYANRLFNLEGNKRGKDNIEFYGDTSFKALSSRYLQFMTKVDYINYILEEFPIQRYIVIKRVFGLLLAQISGHSSFIRSHENTTLYNVGKTTFYEIINIRISSSLYLFPKSSSSLKLLLKYSLMVVFLQLKYLLFPIKSFLKNKLSQKK